MEQHKQQVMAALFSLLLLGIVLSPIVKNWHKTPQDSFPLSYYPMFSKKRAETQVVRYVVGYDAANQRHYIPYHYIGNGGMNQVRRQINKQCKKGNSEKLARKVARRLAKTQEASYQKIERIEVVKGTFHLDNYFIKGDKSPRKEKVLYAQKILKP